MNELAPGAPDYLYLGIIKSSGLAGLSQWSLSHLPLPLTVRMAHK